MKAGRLLGIPGFTFFCLCCTVAFGGSGATAARAQTGLLSHSAADFASHDGNIAFLGLGVGLPLLTDGSEKKNHTLRAADGLGVSVILSEGIKNIVREKRPDSSERDSFPSGHATAAFAVAMMESHFHRQAAPLWFLGAFLIADSRVTLHRHYPKDVVAGALLGTGTSLAEIAMPRGLLLSPFITRSRSSSRASETAAPENMRGISFALHF